MAIEFVPGRGWVNTEGDYVLGGETDQAITQAYQDELTAFLNEHDYNPDTKYDWSGLYGSTSGQSYTPQFGDGPNDSWSAALYDRLMRRQRGELSGVGHFETRLRTAERGYTGTVYDRNNAIEEMYRSGYSRKQIQDFLDGKVDMDNFQPDWKDYYAAQREALGSGDAVADAATLLSGGQLEDRGEFWGDTYFYDRPERNTSNPLDGMMGQPGQASSGSFMDAYRAKRGMLEGGADNPIQPDPIPTVPDLQTPASESTGGFQLVGTFGDRAAGGSLTERAGRKRTAFDRSKFDAVRDQMSPKKPTKIASLFKEMKEWNQSE